MAVHLPAAGLQPRLQIGHHPAGTRDGITVAVLVDERNERAHFSRGKFSRPRVREIGDDPRSCAGNGVPEGFTPWRTTRESDEERIAAAVEKAVEKAFRTKTVEDAVRAAATDAASAQDAADAATSNGGGAHEEDGA